MKKCPSCQTENSDDTRFCRECGKEIAAAPQQFSQVRCPRCGNINPPDTRYCGSCGQPLTQEAANQTYTKTAETNPKKVKAKDHPSYGQYTAISILLPIVGFIIGIVSLCKNSLVDKKLGEHAIATSLFWGLFLWPVLIFVFTSCIRYN